VNLFHDEPLRLNIAVNSKRIVKDSYFSKPYQVLIAFITRSKGLLGKQGWGDA
jgi:hypothetical protein